MRNLYLLFVGALLITATSCKKTPSSNNGSGNVPGDTTKTNPTGKDVPSGAGDGVTFINGGKSAIFNLYAPNKKSVTLIGDFSGWSTTDTKYAMTNSVDGTRWWIQIDGLDPNTEYAYQYYIDKSLKVGDPYCEKVLDPANDKYIPTTVYPNLKAYPTGKTTGIVSVMQANQPYTWKNTSFTRPDPKNLVVYELLVRDFVATHSYKTLTDTLNYMKRLGVNAIELMPFNEFEGNDSWGYNPNYYFAPDKYYGTKNDLKAFIDACHGAGIAVIQDIVLNHSFGSSPMVQMYADANGVPLNNPWYNTTPTHPYNVGYQFNHESAATKYFVKNVLKFWTSEYKIDGFRFDLAKGFTQTNSGTDVNAWGNYDASRVAIWKNYNNYIKSLDPKLYVILEYFAGNQEEGELANEGMMTWTNLSTPGEQATMGYNDAGGSWDISGLFYDGYGFTNPYALVAYFESHDQERLQYKNGMYGNASGTYSVKDLPTGLKRDEMGAAFMFSSPGPKMVWQFGERGYDVTIGTDDVKLQDKLPHWEYMNDVNRQHLFKVYSQMINWKKNNAVFTSTNFKYSLGGAVKTIQMLDASNNIEVVGNFGVTAATTTITFPSTGTWTDNFTGATINVTSLTYTIPLAPGEYHLYSSSPLK
ncbi:MAG: alpha-amylase family glycosyl hydrolase [Bacteroidota bacterium]|nr:alpha-amylase family glycosyl hydrolase [Bacteroidota bacterium]